MIVQARIMSDTEATLHLPDSEQVLTAPTLPELRAHVKQAFVEEARRRNDAVDVQIVEPDRIHHLRVEPNGRVARRVPDDRPVYGPDSDTPIVPRRPDLEDAASAEAPAAPAAEPEITHVPGTEDPGVGPAPEAPGHRGRHAQDLPPVEPEAPAPITGTHAAIGTPSPAPEAAVPEVEPGAGTPAPGPADTTIPPAPEADAPTAEDVETPPAATPVEDEPAGQDTPSPAPDAPTPAERHEPVRATSPGPALGPDGTPLPTLEDLRSASRPIADAPPTRGFPAFITKLTGGAITPRPNRAERLERAETDRIRRDLDTPRNIVVVNLKGGAHKTTACLMIAATLGVARGGSVLAWDNNETRGTLGWRGAQGDNHHTVRDLLEDLEALGDGASAADMDRYVRHQGVTRFDVLASDEDAGSAVLMDGPAFDRLNEALSRFYRVKVIDTGNNVRASNWLAAVGSADQLVIISTVREDTFNAAAWMIDELRATGYAEKVDHAVTLLSHSSAKGIDKVLHRRLLQHFGAHTRAVHEVPFEKQFVDGGELDWSRVSPDTKRAWLAATATIVDGL